MPSSKPPLSPPRPLSPGDVVATFCEELGEWTAAQILALDPRHQAANAVDLNWSGSKPASVDDLTANRPLRAVGSAYSRDWVLPRSHTVIGTAPLVRPPSQYFSRGWWTGRALYEHRTRSRGQLSSSSQVDARIGEARLHRLLDDHSFVDRDLLHLTLTPGSRTGPIVDCSHLVRAFPNLVSLTVWGVMGRLERAVELNQLCGLRVLELEDTFGMGAMDCLEPKVMRKLESIDLRSIPADYARAMRLAWKAEVPTGVHLSITGARTPEWVAQNVANPLRAWDGREGISSRAYVKARAAWNNSTPPILSVLTEELDEQERHLRLEELGASFASAFNDVDAHSNFIETAERDELLDGLVNLVAAAPVAAEVDHQVAIEKLLRGANQTRCW